METEETMYMYIRLRFSTNILFVLVIYRHL